VLSGASPEAAIELQRGSEVIGADAREDREEHAPSEKSRGVIVATGIFAGFALLAAIDAVVIAVRVPVPAAGLRLRVAHHVFDAAETLGVGALVALAIGAFVHFVRLPRWAMTSAAVAATIAIIQCTIGEALTRFAAETLEGRFESAIFLAYLALVAVGLVGAFRVAIFLSRSPRLRFLPGALAVGVLIGDNVWLPDDYMGSHCFVAWGAAMVGGAGIAPLAARAFHSFARRRVGRAALAVLGLFTLFGVAWPPSNAVRFELFRQPCPVAPWFLATILWRAPGLHAPVVLPGSPWEGDRSTAPAVLPTAPRVLPSDAVVVLVTIDALRADAVSDPANDAAFPTLAELKRDGVVFAHASAPGTQTAQSLGTIFSGLYFSEQRWTDHGVGSTRFLYPADDPSPRFPELLSDHGVMTADYAGLVFLGGEFGVVRGFREEKVVVKGRRHALAKELLGPLLDRLRHPAAGPLFLYTHLLEPHWPYDRGRKNGTDHERYLSEVSVADAGLGQIVRLLEAEFGKRWVLLVAADHGEAFGEHQSTEHAKTLYEELLHVPLIARSPLFPARTIDERVGLIDLGPTILDLFGVETPATYDGQSLVPLLVGATTSFTRPLLAEGRLRRALTQKDGFKVIDDPRRKVVEAYDLAADPAETRNLYDVEPARTDRALAELRAFFTVHTYRKGGYELPYKP
jgi:hypothetical protein